MSFLKNLIGIEEDDEDEEEEVEEVEEVKERKPLFNRKNDQEEVKEEKPAAPAVRPSAPAQKQAAPQKRYTEQIKLIVIEPQSFEESPKLVDNLKAKKPVIINLENLPTDVARKIFDFLSGATYALNGNVQKVANNIFLFAPENVDVTYSSGVRQEQPAAEPAKSPWN